MVAQILPIILIFGIGYFLIIRPQQKRMRAHQAMVEALARGDIIVTNAGLIGKVERVEEKELLLELTQGVVVRLLKQAVSEIREDMRGNPASSKSSGHKSSKSSRSSDKHDSSKPSQALEVVKQSVEERIE